MATTIVVKRVFAATIEQAFEAVMNADTYPRLPGMIEVRRVREAGPGVKDGLGTQREITAWPIWFREEVVHYERPHRVDYFIHEARPRFEHQSGRFEFRTVPGGTEVTWSSTFSVPAPMLSGAATALAAVTLKTAFRVGLAVMERGIAKAASVQ